MSSSEALSPLHTFAKLDFQDTVLKDRLICTFFFCRCLVYI